MFWNNGFFGAPESINYKEVFDSLKDMIDPEKRYQRKMENDIDVITAGFLISNIDEAFRVWQFLWAKNLTFDEFCDYILPYKLKNELPELWRGKFWDRYKWILDSVTTDDPGVVLSLVNNDLSKWFYVSEIDVPFDLNASDLLKVRSGKCPQEVQIATYAMRAMGISVAMDGVPYWGNRNKGHDWNAFSARERVLPFLGSEVNPGEYKLEFPWPASIASRRPKVWRWSYQRQLHQLSDYVPKDEVPIIFNNERLKDVSDKYLSDTDVRVSIDNKERKRVAFLCVFNDLNWKPVQWGLINGDAVIFNGMAKNIVYMPAIYDEGEMISVGTPFLLKGNGKKRKFTPDFGIMDTLVIDRKYPSGVDNHIRVGLKYRLLFWNDGWKIVGDQVVRDNILRFNNLPKNGLFWLRCLNEGVQERVFEIKNQRPKWW